MNIGEHLNIRNLISGLPLAGGLVVCLLFSDYFPAAGAAFFSLVMLSGLAGAVVCYYLIPRGAGAYASWLAVSVMLVFGYLKYFYILLFPEAPNMFFPKWVWPFFSRQDLLLPVFAVQTLAFTVLCAGIIFFHIVADMLWRDDQKASVIPEISPAVQRGVLMGLSGIAALLFWLVKSYNIGILGVPSSPLPFRFSGLIYYSQTVLLPVMILAQIALSEKTGAYKLSRGGLLLLFIWAGADAVVRGSRASLLIAPLLTIGLSVCGGLRLRKRELSGIVAAVLIALLLAPLAVQYRELRVQGVGLGETLTRLPGNVPTSLAGISKTAVFFFLRIPGVETLFAIKGMQAAPLNARSAAVLLSADGLPGYLTRDVLKVDYVMAFAPSLSGGGYLLFGHYGVAAFSIGAAFVAVFGWRVLRRMRLRFPAVSSSFCLLLFFFLLTEGLTPILLKQTLAVIISVFICEYGAYLFGKGVKT